MQIAPEVGLSAQKYKCKECRVKIAINPNEAKLGTLEARFCNYTGYYFCPTCHWRDSRIIPARVVLNWDFCEYEVSRSSYRYLYSAYKRVLLNVSEENEQIFSFVEELQQIRKLRQDILRMKVYLSCCPDAAGARLLLRLQERQHFVESADEYSVHDLVEIANGSLIDSLTEVHADYARHIKLDCVRCQAKGFICEICNLGNVLFPFDSLAAVCAKCGAVYHKECFNENITSGKGCPRCIRQSEKRNSLITKTFPEEDKNLKFNPFLRDDEILPTSGSPSFS